MRLGLLFCVLVGCIYDAKVEVDVDSLDLPRGTSRDVVVSIDDIAVDSLDTVLWQIADPTIANALPSLDQRRLRINGNLEGATIVRVGTRGQVIDIPTRVGPPAIAQMWIEPSEVTTSVGELIEVKAVVMDTVFQLRDITHDSHWLVTDPSVASLDINGMMLRATGRGQTTLHATHGRHATMVQITISE